MTAVEDGTGDASPSRFVPEIADALGGYGADHHLHGDQSDEVPLDGGIRRLLSLPSMVAATTVVPIPANRSSSPACFAITAFALQSASVRILAGSRASDSRMLAKMVFTAQLDAYPPALCPPIPSATKKIFDRFPIGSKDAYK